MYYRLKNETGRYRDKTSGELRNIEIIDAIPAPSGNPFDNNSGGWVFFDTLEEMIEYSGVTAIDFRTAKIEELETAYLAWQNAGWTDNISGYTLFLSDKDKINYTQLKSIIFDRPDNTICEVGTTTGWQQIEKTILYDMLKRYGEEAFATYKKLSDLIIYVNFIAQTEEEVNAVSW